MAKTFDNISEASATNYLFLFAQRTLALQNEPPTPPPLNVLGLPCKVTCLLWGLMQSRGKAPPPDTTGSERATTSSPAETLEASAETKEAPPSSPPPSPSSEEGTRGQEAPLIAKIAAENIVPLAKQIRNYILDHQDDAAQEDRWRTTMQRKMSESFRVQHEKVQKVEMEVQKVETEMQSMQLKLVEIVGLIKRLALEVDKKPNYSFT